MPLKRRTLVKAAGACALLGARLPAAAAAGARYEWHSVPYGAGGFVDGFLFHPTERGLLYARTDIGGAYRFDEASQSWIPLLDHLDRADADLMGVLSLAVDPHDPDRLYAACGLYLDQDARPGALLVSADRGASWQVHELGVHLGGNWYGRGSGERLQVDPRDGKVLWLGTTQDGLLRSSDGGRSFHRTGLLARHVSMVLIDAERAEIYAGSHDNPGLYVSHDGGRRFFPVEATPAQPPQQAALGRDGQLYVSFAQGDGHEACNPSGARRGSVWKRTRDGQWSEITPQPATRFGYAAVDVHPGGRVVVSTIDRHAEGDEIFLSDDGGAHWTPVGRRSQHDAAGYPWLQDYMRTERNLGHWTSAVRLDPFDADRALYGTGYGVWMTRDLGAAARDDGTGVHWRFTVANFEETATLEIRSPAQGPRLIAAVGDIAGGAWVDPSRPLGTGFFAPTKETNRSIDFAELAPNIIARTGDHHGGYWTDDGGANWHVFERLPRTEVQYDGETLAVSARGGAFVYAPYRGPAHCSHDRGKTWTPCRGWPDSDAFLKPVADRAAEGVFYVHDRAGGRILVSTDGGRQFKPLLTDLPRLHRDQQAAHLLSAPGAPGDLWLALDDRLLHLPGRDRPVRRVGGVAQAWMLALGKGLPDGAYRHSLYLWGRVSQGAVEAVEGLFRSDDGGESFVRINDDAHRYGRLLCMAGDAREHGVLYIAPHGRGVGGAGPAGHASRHPLERAPMNCPASIRRLLPALLLAALPAWAAERQELPLLVDGVASKVKVHVGGFSVPERELLGDSVRLGPVNPERPDSDVIAHPSGKNGARDAVTMQWKEAWLASLRLVADTPLDLRPYLPGGTLEFDLKVVDMAHAGLSFVMGCGADCSRKVRWVLPSRALQGKGWQHLSFALQCFARDGNDFSTITQPLGVDSSGTGEMAIANVKIVRGGRPNAECVDYRVESVTPMPQTEVWALDWWMQRHEEKLKQAHDSVAAGHAPRLVFVGDSITHNWETTGKKVWDQYFAHDDALNLGFSGDRTENVLWRLQHGELDGYAAKLVVMMIGTNNTGDRREDPRTTAAGVKRLLDEIRSRQPKAQVLLLAVFPRDEQPTSPLRELNDRLNGLISGYADGRQVHFLNINESLTNPDGSLSREVMPDLLHPNEKGYALWAQAIEPAVRRLLSE